MKIRIIALIIFSIIVTKVTAQNTIHLCVGSVDNNFSVPYTSGSTYQWQIKSNSSIASITSGNGTEHILIDLNNIGMFKLIVEEIDVNGCSGFDSIWVQIHDLPYPKISALGPTSFCQGDYVMLQLDSIYTQIIWNNGANTSTIYADSSADYFVTVTDLNGCSNSSNLISVDVHPNPVAIFNSTGKCFRESTLFTDISTIAYDSIIERIWTINDSYIDSGISVSYTFNNIGDFQNSLLVISDFGCRDSVTSSITIHPKPIADFSYSPASISIIDSVVTFINKSSLSSSFFWNFGDSSFSINENPIHIYKEPGVYNVSIEVTDSNLCIDSVSQKLVVFYDFILYIPNSFTPNGDNQNDLFGPLGVRMEKYTSYEFIIFDRWGSKIFETNNFNDFWSGDNLPSGNYAWTIRIIDEVGAIHRRTGSVLLIK